MTDEKFFAWLDGELPTEEAAAVEAEVAADPALQRLRDEHRTLEMGLRAAFDPVATAPVSERLRSLVAPNDSVLRFARSTDRRRMPTLPEWAALAATLAIGFSVGTMIPSHSGTAPIALQNGKLVAAAALDTALSTQLASAPQGAVRIGLTFRDKTGAFCRTFDEAAASGLACRDAGRWRLRGLFAPAEGSSTDYRMAAGMDPNLAALVETTMSNEPLDAAGEKAARGRGWK